MSKLLNIECSYTSACQVIHMCIRNGVTQLAKAWPVNMRLEVRACERRDTVNMQRKVSYSEPVHVVSVM